MGALGSNRVKNICSFKTQSDFQSKRTLTWKQQRDLLKYHDNESAISIFTRLETNPIIKCDIQKEASDVG